MDPEFRTQPQVRVGAIVIASRNPHELAQFYADGLGLADPEEHAEDHVGVVAGSTYLGFDLVQDPPAGGPRTTIWFDVDDCEAVFARLVSLGATPIHAPDPALSPGETLARARDPDGNAIGLIGPGPKRGDGAD